jgi:AcrR family transcriptional regulator
MPFAKDRLRRPRPRPPEARPPRAGRGSGERWDAAGTKAALLAAGAALFAESGFDGVPTAALAARAGVNKALISYHFGGKRGLYQAILAQGFAEMAARLKAVEARGEDAAKTLRGLLGAFAAVRARRPDFPMLFVREVLSHGLDPVVLPYLVEVLGVTRRFAERGMRDGAFRRVHPAALHLALVGSLVFFLATEKARRRAIDAGVLPPMPDFPEYLRYVQELTLRGLRPDRPTPVRPRKGAHA